MRVLIVRLGAFGDIIHTLPLAADLHRAGHRIGWACEDRWSCVVRDNPLIEKVHALPRKLLRDPQVKFPQRWLLVRQFMRDIQHDNYDVVIDAQGLLKSALVAGFSGAAKRIGHASPRSREGSWLISRTRVTPQAVHVIDQQRALGLPLLGDGMRGGWRFVLPAWKNETAWAAQWFAGLHLPSSPVMLNVGAGWPTKVWPKTNQVAFAQRCAEQSLPLILLWGSPAERVMAEDLVREVPSAIMAPPSTIPQLAALIRHARVLVSGDTGPLHLGMALGRPAVGLFGPVPAARNGPRGRGYRTLQAPGAAWERKDISKVNMGALSAEDVLAAALAASGEYL
jgi:heptosyltransferase I